MMEVLGILGERIVDALFLFGLSVVSPAIAGAFAFDLGARVSSIECNSEVGICIANRSLSYCDRARLGFCSLTTGGYGFIGQYGVAIAKDLRTGMVLSNSPIFDHEFGSPAHWSTEGQFFIIPIFGCYSRMDNRWYVTQSPQDSAHARFYDCLGYRMAF